MWNDGFFGHASALARTANIAPRVDELVVDDVEQLKLVRRQALAAALLPCVNVRPGERPDLHGWLRTVTNGVIPLDNVQKIRRATRDGFELGTGTRAAAFGGALQVL